MTGTAFQKIKIKGYKNTWSAFDSAEIDDIEYLIFKNDQLGNKTCYLVCRVDGEALVLICETFDDIITALEDAEVIQ